MRIPLAQCPTCNSILDGAIGAAIRGPEKGDLTVCVYCGEISRFTDGLQLERAPDESITHEAREAAAFILSLIYSDVGTIH
jgi:RNase P subunit RPR2